ncbi:hypothetical protein ACFX5Q_07420 [Mesorhizobium sp. IMUNJ 23033]|uniref:hypothetical protein n=1 Tax=Mesorhizobium sp. IMUNJ 23033 TaxID=3378039 RepID=UPI00385161A5
MIININLDGLTPDQIEAKNAAALDRAIDAQLERDELFLFDHGDPTEQEVADFLAMRRTVLAEWKAECMAEVTRWLSDENAPTTNLQ